MPSDILEEKPVATNKSRSRRWVKTAVFATLGAGAGYAWYYFVGCPTGTCPLSANPYLMVGVGALLGFSFSR